MLFTDRSLWTMLHGIVLGGLALMGLAAALFALYSTRQDGSKVAAPLQARTLSRLTVVVAVTLWLTVLGGTYVVFPPYRAPPPAGVSDLSQYPRAQILANADTAWLHAFAMESKEHVPWIASMLATAVAFVIVRYRSRVFDDSQLRSMAITLLGICFILVSFVALMGIFVNKVAPLQ